MRQKYEYVHKNFIKYVITKYNIVQKKKNQIRQNQNSP